MYAHEEPVNDRFRAEFSGAQVNAASVMVIGCGATGSWIALNLARLGVPRIYLIDDDAIETANIGVQPFHLGQVGLAKAIIVAQLINLINPTCAVCAHIKKWRATSNLNFITRRDTIIVPAVDSLSSRRAIYRSMHRYSATACTTIIDPRMGFNAYEVFVYGRKTKSRYYRVQASKNYAASLTGDDIAANANCGRDAIIDTAMSCASDTVRIIRKVIMRQPVHAYTYRDCDAGRITQDTLLTGD